MATTVAAQGSGTVAMQTVRTGLGFSVSVPAAWTRGDPIRNDKLVIGARDDDFALVVADFGPAQADTAQALAVYRESFLKNGFTPVTETETTVAGRTFPRFVLRLDSPDGEGHAEAVLVRSGDEIYAVLVVTPAASLEDRRATIARIFESITLD